MSGGTTVTINGTGFSGATAVTLDGLDAAHFEVASSTRITAVTPPHDEGAVRVRVTTPNGSSTQFVTLDAVDIWGSIQ